MGLSDNSGVDIQVWSTIRNKKLFECKHLKGYVNNSMKDKVLFAHPQKSKIVLQSRHGVYCIDLQRKKIVMLNIVKNDNLIQLIFLNDPTTEIPKCKDKYCQIIRSKIDPNIAYLQSRDSSEILEYSGINNAIFQSCQAIHYLRKGHRGLLSSTHLFSYPEGSKLATFYSKFTGEVHETEKSKMIVDKFFNVDTFNFVTAEHGPLYFQHSKFNLKTLKKESNIIPFLITPNLKNKILEHQSMMISRGHPTHLVTSLLSLENYFYQYNIVLSTMTKKEKFNINYSPEFEMVDFRVGQIDLQGQESMVYTYYEDGKLVCYRSKTEEFETIKNLDQARRHRNQNQNHEENNGEGDEDPLHGMEEGDFAVEDDQDIPNFMQNIVIDDFQAFHERMNQIDQNLENNELQVIDFENLEHPDEGNFFDIEEQDPNDLLPGGLDSGGIFFPIDDQEDLKGLVTPASLKTQYVNVQYIELENNLVRYRLITPKQQHRPQPKLPHESIDSIEQVSGFHFARMHYHRIFFLKNQYLFGYLGRRCLLTFHNVHTHQETSLDLYDFRDKFAEDDVGLDFELLRQTGGLSEVYEVVELCQEQKVQLFLELEKSKNTQNESNISRQNLNQSNFVPQRAKKSRKWSNWEELRTKKTKSSSKSINKQREKMAEEQTLDNIQELIEEVYIPKNHPDQEEKSEVKNIEIEHLSIQQSEKTTQAIPNENVLKAPIFQAILGTCIGLLLVKFSFEEILHLEYFPDVPDLSHFFLVPESDALYGCIEEDTFFNVRSGKIVKFDAMEQFKKLTLDPKKEYTVKKMGLKKKLQQLMALGPAFNKILKEYLGIREILEILKDQELTKIYLGWVYDSKSS